jgi:hypothetical protein
MMRQAVIPVCVFAVFHVCAVLHPRADKRIRRQAHPLAAITHGFDYISKT